MEIVLVIALPGVEKKTLFFVHQWYENGKNGSIFCNLYHVKKNIVYDKDFQSLSRIVCPKKKWYDPCLTCNMISDI